MHEGNYAKIKYTWDATRNTQAAIVVDADLSIKGNEFKAGVGYEQGSHKSAGMVMDMSETAYKGYNGHITMHYRHKRQHKGCYSTEDPMMNINYTTMHRYVLWDWQLTGNIISDDRHFTCQSWGHSQAAVTIANGLTQSISAYGSIWGSE